MKRYVKLKCNQCTELLKHKVTKISALKHFLEKPCDKGLREFLFPTLGQPIKTMQKETWKINPWTLIRVQGECLVARVMISSCKMENDKTT